MPVVFVYGTLMRNESNHHYLESAHFIGSGCAKGLGLYAVTPAYPGAIPEANEKVLGEIYEIDNETFTSLDKLEDYGEFYTRKIYPVKLINSCNTIKAWVYIWLKDVPVGSKITLVDQPWSARKKRWSKKCT